MSSELSEEEINKKALKGAFDSFYENKTGNKVPPLDAQPLAEQVNPVVTPQAPPKININTQSDFQSQMMKETDTDLIVGYEIVPLPSKGWFYENGLHEVKVEYLTSKDEDVLTTPSLIQNNTVLDVILKRKIKTPNVNIDSLLTGDKNALILFLRASSYGQEYEVQVLDPRDGTAFQETVDLTKLKYKEPTEKPDEIGEFNVDLTIRKKIVKLRLLTSGEENLVQQRANSIQETYNHEYSEYQTMKLKAHITEIGGNRDRSYVERFVDAMPLKDVLTIKKKLVAITPNVDMTYKFKTKDGYKFDAQLSVGVDFFFPNL